jgi:hypothetical protein
MKSLYRQVSRNNRAQYVHILVAESALGKKLPVGAEVHHVNENKYDNSPSNLVICQDHAYHRLLHVRARVLAAGGNPNTDKFCPKCKTAKPKSTMWFRSRSTAYCKLCSSDLRRRAYKPTGKTRLRAPFNDGTLPPLPLDTKHPHRRSGRAQRIAALYDADSVEPSAS